VPPLRELGLDIIPAGVEFAADLVDGVADKCDHAHLRTPRLSEGEQ
jgi:hypothetical protein